jgi:hypothetical protein
VDVDVEIVGLGTVEIAASRVSVVQFSGVEATLAGVTVVADGGRGVRVDGGTVDLTNVTITGNATIRTPFDGAGLGVFGGAVVTVRDSEIVGNAVAARSFNPTVAGHGGQVFVSGSDVVIERSRLADGEAVRGAGLYADGASTVRLVDSVLEDLDADRAGGCVWVGAGVTLTVTRSTLRRCVAGSEGGGAIRWDGDRGRGTLTIEETSFSGSRASSGGAVSVAGGGRVVVRDTTFRDDRATGGSGGALRLADVADADLSGVNVCRAQATGVGGAVAVESGTALSVRRSAFVGSQAGTGGGGAIGCSGGSIDVRFSHLLDSVSSGSGAAVRAPGCAAVLDSSLVAWSGAGVAVVADAGAGLTWVATHANAGGDVGGGARLGTGSVSGDPLLLRYTRDGDCGNDDLRTRPGSPLVDAGDPATTDPDGSRADIGPFGTDGPGALGEDRDADRVVGAYDCDDRNATVFPGAAEICDGLDNDCDGVVDGPVPVAAPTWFADDDGDDFGRAGTEVVACVAPARHTDGAGDCDDADPDVNPDADERCNGVDDDCDRAVDGADSVDLLVWYADADEDGRGATSPSIAACEPPGPGFVLTPGDCGDDDPTVGPGQPEACDALDRDCDGDPFGPAATDAVPWFPDTDGDGWGDAGASPVVACAPPEGFGAAGDCDDGDAAVRPLAPETCDGPDANCDGFSGPTDNDGDGFPACEDCDDGDDRRFPGAPEVWYDGEVRDCASASDFDQDRDGADATAYGGTDCDDTDASIGPEAPDAPDDGIDQDCDGADDDPPIVRGFCTGCDGAGAVGAAPAWLAVVLMGAARRRRAVPRPR